uniref:Ig-like domain-containing protein n=1 Tax=Pelusios castaneus TaxID=367368 RepID=A0A8C8S6P7_9SAUR
MLRALILALLWRGKWCFSPSSGEGQRLHLTEPETVSVQESLCVLVPCTFTYQDDTKYYFWNSLPQLHGHWFKYPADVNWDRPVASSDPVREVLEETRGRFQLVGDVMHGNCSLKINDARRTDGGRYFFRVERGGFKYSYRLTHSHTEPRISVPKMLVAGELVTVTCTAPGGRCSGSPPQITWMGPLNTTARDILVPLANSTTAHSSILEDHGKELICTVMYPAMVLGQGQRKNIRESLRAAGRAVGEADLGFSVSGS